MIYTANIGDRVVYAGIGFVSEGFIKLINMRGVNVSTPWGDRFIKWKSITELDKINRAPWVK